ncbi:uncharacterized protein RCC_09205 [Ramularia collo-cygni]|uniref:Uncharacterized protein n=1 Tax=Ramularia collo-cygni TaxID=112498 RepID=A0A2D3VH28_9PEZI|nr:uncharacterized protein RCC_09205 [Ramularia collo-cygni]CZT23491.1 uncharacterized protein RCC_09205 [Ramularia collo-cygni]
MVSSKNIISLLIACIAQTSTAGGPSDQCIFTGGLVGLPNSRCAGSDGKEHSDILSCPSQPGAVDIICPRVLSNGLSPPEECKGLIGSGSYCDSWNSDRGGGKEDVQWWCYCINGNFCCGQNAEVAGGQDVVDYFNDVGCNCDG